MQKRIYRAAVLMILLLSALTLGAKEYTATLHITMYVPERAPEITEDIEEGAYSTDSGMGYEVEKNDKYIIVTAE